MSAKRAATAASRCHGQWTALHKAALRDDEESMRILLEAGADRTITTKIDDDATAEEEARNLGHHRSADFIANFNSDPERSSVRH